MKPDQWQKISSVLDQLLDLTDAERQPLLTKLRQDDPTLAQEIESLLGQHPSANLETPPEPLIDQIGSTRLMTPSGMASARSESAWPGLNKAGRYEIQEEIARGGMGAILRAVDPDFQRVLAVKLLLPEARRDPHAEGRFLQEARITARLQHPGIPPIHELGRLEDGTPFFTMKLIEGKTLTALLTNTGGVKPDQALVGIFEQICRTLAYAHSQGVLHRDLKPGNVMVGAFGEVQVMDWGLAKAKVNSHAETLSSPVTPNDKDTGLYSRAGDVMGTPAYIAPEQARGEIDSLDERCDVFGLGGILCAMLTCQPPFQGTIREMLDHAARGDLSATFERLDRCGADPELVAIARRCLAPRKEDRYRNGDEVSQAITRYRQDVQEKLKAAEIAREKAQTQASEERRRRRLVVGLAATLLILVLGLAGAAVWYQQYSSARLTRATNLNDQVSQTLTDADAELKQISGRLRDRTKVQALLGDLRPWRASLDVATNHLSQARKLADSDPDLLLKENSQRIESLEKSLASSSADEAFARELDALRLEFFHLEAKGNAVVPHAAADAGREARDPAELPGAFAALNDKYIKAFDRRGWPVMQMDAEELASRIRESPARFFVVAACDHWAWTALTKKPHDEVLARRLLELARRADPDPWCDEFRQWEVWANADRLKKHLSKLRLTEQSPHLLGAAADLQRRHGQSPLGLIRSGLSHYPGDFLLNVYLGFHVRSTNVDEAISTYRTALAVRPSDAVVLSNLAFVLRQKGDLESAIRHYDLAIARDPNYVNARCGLASCYLAANNRKACLENYRQALAIGGDHPGIHNDLAVAHFTLGDFAAAERHLSTALKSTPKNNLLRSNYAITLRQLGKYEDALREMRQAHESEPTKMRAGFVAEYENLVTLSRAESAAVVERRVLEAGLNSSLTKTHPTDIYKGSRQSYRASHCVELLAGKSYQIDLGASFDTLLRLEDDRYNLLLYNDDVRYPEVLDSRLIFTPAKTAVYRLVVTSFNRQTTGDYRLKIQEVVPLGDPIVFKGELTTADKKTETGKYYKLHAIDLTAEVPCTFILESKDFNTTIQLGHPAMKQRLGFNESMHWERLRLSRLDVTVGKTSQYTLFAMSAGPGGVGAYTLTVQRYRPASGAPSK